MNLSKKAFSLIEIIISISILTIWVFWVYKLIWNNMNLLSNNETSKTLESLYNPFWECLKYFWFENINTYNIWDKFSVNFWEDNLWCYTWSFDNNYSFSWIKLNNQEFFLFWEITQKEAEKITLKLNIFNDISWLKWFDNYIIKY